MGNDQLTEIDEMLAASLPAGLRVQFAGAVQQIYDPQTNRPVVMRIDSETGLGRRYTLDTKHYDVQVAHRLTGGTPIKSPASWGTRSLTAFDLDFTLLCATKRPDVLPTFVLAFSGLSDVAVREFNTDTLRVLKSEFLYVPDGKTPYDPMLQSFSIRYSLLNVSESVFRLLCNPSLTND